MAVRIRVEIHSHDGGFLQDTELTQDFADREAAIREIERHLLQFDETGYHEENKYWWGRSTREPAQQMRFFIE